MSPTATGRTLSDFEGVWMFDRVVEHASGDRATVTGRATFTCDGAGLVQEEVGRMSLNGAPPLCATRRYLWRAGLQVCFEDGRDFHTVPAEGGTAEHWCDPDHYTVQYEFGSWPDWTATWTVQGPNKDYRMVTRYTRA